LQSSLSEYRLLSFLRRHFEAPRFHQPGEGSRAKYFQTDPLRRIRL
jgi:hypothetical protein